VAQVVDDRGSGGQHDPVLHAEHDDGRRGQYRDGVLAADGQDAPHPAEVDEPDGDEEDHCRQRRDRQVGERPGGKEQDEQHDGAGRELGELAAPARAVGHPCLGGAAVDDERAGERRGDVGGAQSH
jgi:hypothetical protein